MKSGIYWIVAPSGRCYIGSSQNVAKRLWTHRRDLARQAHANEPLQRAANKYGIDALHFSVIEHCVVERLIEREQFYIDAQGFDTLYNTAPIAGATRGVKLSEATRAKMRIAAKRRMESPEVRARIGTTLKGIDRTPEVRARMSAAQRGKKTSIETIARLRDITRARWQDDPEYRKRAMAAQRLAVATPEVRAKMSAAQPLGKSGYRAVVQDNRSKKWQARLTPTGRSLGYFVSSDLAYSWRLVMLAHLEYANG